MVARWLLKKPDQETKIFFLITQTNFCYCKIAGVFLVLILRLMNRFKGILEQSGLFSNLVVLFAFICFFVLVLSPLTALIPVTNPPSVSFMKLSQLVLSTAVFILPPLALAYLCSKSNVNYLHFDKKTRIYDAGFVILVMLIIMPFVNLLGDMNHHLG